MNSNRNIFRIVFLFLVIVGIMMYVNYRTAEKDRNLLYSILVDVTSRNQTGELPLIDFSNLTTFSWDRLYIFGPYTSPEKIDSILGNFWIGSRFTSIKSSDRITLLVFIKGGRVVEYLEFPRGQADFSTADNGLGYTVEEARFIVDEQGRVISISDK